MSKSKPTVQKFMTTDVKTIDAGKTIQDAVAFMKEHEIRHLPVISNGEVVGIITDRDIKNILGIVDLDAQNVIIRDACKDVVYIVSPDAGLDDVAQTMAEKHYGSAVVIQNNQLVGILTTVDICRALYSIINQRFHGE